MNYKNLLPGILLVFISTTGFSQPKQIIYYFDKDLTITEMPKAVFKGIGLYTNGVLDLKIYNASNNSLVIKEHYTDSTLQVKTGLFQSYYGEGLMETEGNYFKGRQQGLWTTLDSAGHVIDSSIFSNGDIIHAVHTGYFKNGSLDSVVVRDTKTDQLLRTYYDDKGKILSEVNFTGQMGLYKLYDKGQLTTSERVFTRAETEAYFPGGEEAWTQYMSAQLSKNIKALLKDNKSGTCRIKFIVDKNGNIANAEVMSMQGSKLAKISLNAIVNGPKWQPAVQYGKPLNAYREQPVTFTIQDN